MNKTNGATAYFYNYIKQENQLNPFRKEFNVSKDYNFTNHLILPKDSYPANAKFTRIEIFADSNNKQQIVQDVHTNYSKKGNFVVRFKFEDDNVTYDSCYDETYTLNTYFICKFGNAEYELCHKSCFPCTWQSAISENESDSDDEDLNR